MEKRPSMSKVVKRSVKSRLHTAVSAFAQKIRTSYKRKLFFNFVLLSLIPVLTASVVVIFLLYRSQVKQVLWENEHDFRRSTAFIDARLSSLTERASLISQNVNLLQLSGGNFNGKFDELYDLYAYFNELFAAFAVDSSKSVTAVYIDNDSLYNGSSVRKMEKLSLLVFLSLKNASEVWMINSRKESTSVTKKYLSYYRRLLVDGKIQMVIEAGLPVSSISEAFLFNVPAGGFISQVFDEYDVEISKANAVSEEQAEGLTLQYLDKGDLPGFYNISLSVEHALLDYYLFIPRAYISKQLSIYLIVIFAVCLVIIAVIILSINLSSKLLSHQLERIVKEINFDVDNMLSSYHELPLTSSDEFSKISEKLNQLIAKIRKNHEEIMSFEEKRKTLELMVLQDRINPHLLYNTLSAIKYTYREDNLSKIIDTMVQYYRMVLSKGCDEIPVSSELEMLKKYLHLYRFAYDAHYRYEFTVDDDIKNCVILKMILQPFVENALLHGISGMGKDGLIKLDARASGEDIELTIRDNGCGMSSTRAREVLTSNYERISTGYGIYNVLERIRMFYGEGYGIAIESSPGEGTVISIRIPRKYADGMPEAGME